MERRSPPEGPQSGHHIGQPIIDRDEVRTDLAQLPLQVTNLRAERPQLVLGVGLVWQIGHIGRSVRFAYHQAFIPKAVHGRHGRVHRDLIFRSELPIRRQRCPSWVATRRDL